MRRHGVTTEALPSVRRVTHSGDALDPSLFTWVYERFGCNGVDIYLMYGQTEAGGRISVLPPARLPALRGSVGKAVWQGALSLEEQDEITYRGPGVMMGYATSRDDLVLGDVMGGVLRTGDTGRFDEEGFLYITGRLSRHCKIFGRRMSLDHLEELIRSRHCAAVVEKEGTLIIFLETGGGLEPGLRASLARQLRLPPQLLRTRAIERLPRTARGKIDYRSLLSLD
jgi:acyl-coenzyme A synthetase/AMP-(fatty) acid ligase